MILCPTLNDGLTRNGAFMDPARDWSRALWVNPTLTPGASEFLNLWTLSADGDFTPPWLWAGTLAEGLRFFASADNGSGEVDSAPPGVVLVNAWFYHAVTYTASTTVMRQFIGGVQQASALVDLSGVSPQTVEMAGTNVDISAGGLGMGYVRSWQASLSAADFAREMASRVAVTRVGLLADTPLTTLGDLADLSGHDRDWDYVGEPDTYTVVPDALTVSCARGQITLTGQQFPPLPTVLLVLDGVSVPNTVLSASDTTIVIRVATIVDGGSYSVVVS